MNVATRQYPHDARAKIKPPGAAAAGRVSQTDILRAQALGSDSSG
jgi:hypothetical protein